LVKLYMTVIYS